MMHLLLILLAIFFASRKQLLGDQNDFISLFKAGMRAGVVYAIAIAVFCYFFYAKVAPEVFATRNAALLERIPDGPEAAAQREMITNMFKPSKFAQGTFFGYFLISVFYSLVAAFLQKKVLSRF